MAADDTTPPALTLELGSDKVHYRDFQNIVRAFTGLLRDISNEACGDPNALHWEISVSEGSLLIEADLPKATDANIANRVRSTVRRPPQRIRDRLNSFPRSIPVTRLLAGEDRKDILHEEHGRQGRHPSQISEYGTVEGTLDTLSARGGFHFTISEPIWNMAVRLTVPDDLTDALQGMWRQRVTAHGIVHYDQEGLPTSIRAETVEPFPYDDTPLGEYRGLLAAD